MNDRPAFRPGNNVAMKMPPAEYDRLVAFYRDTLGFEVIGERPASTVFRFGDKRLWVDRVPTLSQGEVWLEVQAEDVTAAAAWFAAQGVTRRDEIEELPDGFAAFWIAAPGGMIHLVTAG
ncbi:VOC family protein [Falsiroseomonas oryzae]|uniref:VOC family protein n=1 Tax=Falsiroseomonas oryzae TaxID=2766473 RepID=UPI0022EA5288|nr:VOC family protein [Roseomonas sp. MO-31]